MTLRLDPRYRLTTSGAVVLLGVLALGLAGCVVPAPPVPVAAAQPAVPTGTLRLLGSANEEYVRGMVRAFEADTGIQTVYERLSTGDALARLQGTAAAP